MNCLFCDKCVKNGEPTVVLRQKGCESINAASTILGKHIVVHPGQTVHRVCRREFCHHRDVRRSNRQNTPCEQSRTLRSPENSFSFNKQCLFCGKYVSLTANSSGFEVYPVRTFDFQKKIEALCARRLDKWAEHVQSRLRLSQDLPAADALYHQICSVNFRTGKNIPNAMQNVESMKSPKGRPGNQEQLNAFVQTANYLESNDDEQITITDLVEKMESFSPGNAYTNVYMKKKLQERFGQSIVITDINGKANVVTFKTTASAILNEFYNQPKLQDPESKKMAIIEAAAKLIQTDIKDMHSNKDVYPLPSDLESIDRNTEFLPSTLRTFIATLFQKNTSSLTMSSIGQAIIQSVRPRVIMSPLQIGLAVQLHHQFASRFLVDILHNLGFCSSYAEVTRFERSAAVSLAPDILGITDTNVVQFSGDNVDHNIRTLDGHDTFHGMGIIGSVTPGIECDSPIPRLSVTTNDLIQAGQIDIRFYKTPPISRPLTLLELQNMRASDTTEHLDIMLSVIWPIRRLIPGWSGFMQSVQKDDFPGKSTIKFLPMIDLNSSDMSCIYSTLHFICSEATKFQQIAPMVTFDQPLYWKALTIIQNENESSPLKHIILRLGGFHLEMSFLGTIGHLMQSSGLFELLETVYATNAVEHMFTGKAVSRAVRGHFLVYSALQMMLISHAYDLPLPCNATATENDALEDQITPEGSSIDVTEEHDRDRQENDVHVDITEVAILYDKLNDSAQKVATEDSLTATAVTENISPKSISEMAVFDRVKTKINAEKQRLSEFPTAHLWLQYMELVDILKRFIKAERTGDWKLHLQAVHDMLPYLAASGHNMYVKSAYVYLQQMYALRNTRPEVHALFEKGYHVVRRTARYWAGISTDLAIEQTLMRSVKTSGGMTRGKGMSEVQRVQWLLSMPACASVNDAIQVLTDVKYSTSDQHKESSPARQKRDTSDVLTMLSLLQERNPFTETPSLRNIETGVNATTDVNVHKAGIVGQNIVDSLHGKDAFAISFKRNQQVITMNSKAAMKVDGESVFVSPQLLFQRLVLAANKISDDLPKVFAFELSSFPSSLFDTSGAMREAQKPSLADAIWALGDCAAPPIIPDTEVQYVLDGGSLLHKISWPRGATFATICRLYTNYVSGKYGAPVIVFDGYGAGPSTKDATHQRRTRGVVGTNVMFSNDTPFKTKKEHFLANTENKQSFINLLSIHLRQSGCNVLHAESDADVRIVKSAVTCASVCHTVLIGEDTDILVLLCFYANMDTHDIHFKSENKPSGRKNRIWSIQKTKEVLGFDTCGRLPFLHAVTGCDTTSRLFGIGKGQALKKLKTNLDFQEQADKFTETDATHEQVEKAGEEVLKMLYNGRHNESLNMLRFRKFSDKVSQSSCPVQVHSLPPTSAAAKFHNFRVFFQIQQWINEDNDIDPQKWGWEIANGMYVPVKTCLAVAPEELLKIIRCNCKANCDTKRCTCRRHGLDCSMGCGECRGLSCANSPSAPCDIDVE